MLKKGKEIILFLALPLIISGCGGETDKSRSEVVAAVKTESVSESVKYTKIFITEKIHAVTASATEAVIEETESDQSEEYENEFEKFKDEVIVIGDSIALGYSAYERLPMKHVFAKQNASPSKMDDFKYDYAGSEASALTILNDLQPDFIMLSMGLNDITTYSAEVFAEKYKGFADCILESCPGSEIYIMGLTPVKSDCDYTSNKSIDEYNNKLSEEFEGYNTRIHFVNAGIVLKNDNGSLNMDYSGGDGIHLSGAAYDKLLEELKNYLYK